MRIRSRAEGAATVRATVAGIAALLLTALPSQMQRTTFNNYVLFAYAVLHGRLWIDWPGPFIDAVLFDGRRYIVNDPVPGFLLVPYVAFAGSNANQTLLAVVLGGVAGFAAWRLAERLDVPPLRRFAVWAFFYFGTDLWWGSVLGDVWFLAQTSAVAFSLLALAELARRAPRGWLVGCWYVLAVGSRFTLVMGAPVVAYFVWRGGIDPERPPTRAERVRRLAWFAGVCAAYAALWIAYNEARWGVPWDSGHTIFYHEDGSGTANGSPFGLQHVPYQISSFFLAAPTLLDHKPWIVPDIMGTALTWTSPALLFAFWARHPRPSVRALWLAVALTAAPSFLYYVNGYAQFGMRHALDFEPYLLVLMLLAARDRLPKWFVPLEVYSIAATSYGIWYWLEVVR